MLSNEVYTIFPIPNKSSFWKFHGLEQGFVYFYNYRLNLKTGKKEKFPIQKFLNILETINFNDDFIKPRVIHLFYELGHLLNSGVKFSDKNILAIDLKYLQRSPYHLKNENVSIRINSVNGIKYPDYKKKFSFVRRNLLEGNCYQLNLTFPFKFSFFKGTSFEEIISKLWDKKWNQGAYAHASLIPQLNKIFISNSPECLFQIKKKKSFISLWSMPIKGSIKTGEKDNLKKNWEKLKNCKKNQAELFMISDLIKNDLAKIEKPIAKVVLKKMPLKVPNILHQYSLIAVKLSRNTNLFSIIKCLFPGGSVTGAPKKKSMEILLKAENKEPRGFYCGSTIILHKSLLAGSINIRSATLDTMDNNFTYGSGGGVTLLSNSKKEFDEMNLKFQSFIQNIIK